MTVKHVYTALVPSPGPATTVIAPSNWNDNHSLAYSLSGNIQGSSYISGTNIILQGGPGITLSGSGSTINIFESTISNVGGVSNLGNTAGTSGVVSDNGIRMIFAGGNNITLSQSISSNSATITVNQQTGPGQIMSFFEPVNFWHFRSGGAVLHTSLGTATDLRFFVLPQPLTISYIQYVISQSLITNSTKDNFGYSHSFWLLSRNATNPNVLNTFASTAFTSNLFIGSATNQNNISWSINGSTSIGNTSLVTGMGLVCIPFSTFLTMGEYWVAEAHTQSGSTGANQAMTIQFLYNTNQIENFDPCYPGEDANAVERGNLSNVRFQVAAGPPDNVSIATANTLSVYPGVDGRLYIGFRGYGTANN